jgi:hypothetical protein
MTTDLETAAEFLRSRATWLRVETVDNPGGCWSVVLRLDGYYIPGVDKDEMVRFFQERLIEVFQAEGIPPRMLHDWARPIEREEAS